MYLDIMGGMRKDTPSPKTTRSWKARRARAERLFAAGERQAEVARLLGVSRQCVHNWFRCWQGGEGEEPRARRPGSGRRPKLSPELLAEVDAALRRGPEHFGYAGRRWTLDRVAEAIEKITGVRYHPSSVWRILRAMGWKLRYPAKKARARTYVAREWSAPGVRAKQTVPASAADGDGSP